MIKSLMPKQVLRRGSLKDHPEWHDLASRSQLLLKNWEEFLTLEGVWLDTNVQPCPCSVPLGFTLWCSIRPQQSTVGWGAETTTIYCLTALEPGSPKSRCQVICFCENSLPGLQRTSFCVLTQPFLCVWVQRGRSPSSSSCKAANPIMRAPLPWPDLSLIISLKPHLQTPPHCGFRASLYEFGEI